MAQVSPSRKDVGQDTQSEPPLPKPSWPVGNTPEVIGLQKDLGKGLGGQGVGTMTVPNNSAFF